MDTRVIKLTESAIKYGNLNLRSCGKDFFPPDVFGGPNRKSGIGNPITLRVEGLAGEVKTDIPTDARTHRPRWIFRDRAWVREFIRLHTLAANDTIAITRLNKNTYAVCSNNNHSKTIDTETDSETMTTITQIAHKACSINTHLATVQHSAPLEKKSINIGYERTCNCPKTHINCLSPKEWLKCQLGVWQFNYGGRDVRDKKVHPATFPIALARKLIELFTHKGELILDPFVGSGTTLVAAQDAGRNAVGFDLQKRYVDVTESRLNHNSQLFGDSKQIAVCDDAINIPNYLASETVSLIFTSPPYANLLNRQRRNKSRRHRNNEQLGKIEQYSQDPRDLGTMALTEYTLVMGDIFERLITILRPRAHCVINVPDMWWEDKRMTIHVSLIEELRRRGYELRNIIIWDRTNIVNQIGIFGWPSNYITMGVTFEYLLDFWRVPDLHSRSDR